MVTVTLEDTLTPTEHNLVKQDQHERLRDLRLYFQYSNVPEFCGPIEEVTGRKVRAFISGIDTKADGLRRDLRAPPRGLRRALADSRSGAFAL